MRIGIIAHDRYPISEPYCGGLEMITKLLVDSLVERGHEVVTLCLEGSDVGGKMIYYKCVPNRVDVNKNYSEFKTFYKSFNVFLEQGFDVIHNHSLSHNSIIAGNLLTTPFITSFHTPMFDNIEIALSTLSNKNQVFTTVSQSLARTYSTHLDNIYPVYNGIELKKWKYNYTKEDYFTWSGRICKEKGLKETMDLCYDNKIKLLFAGPIANNDYFYSEILPRLEIYDNCEYLGHLLQTELNDVIGKARAYVFSSTWEEPYGLVLAESLASGTPIIANNIGAAPEIIDKTCGILFNLDDANSFKLGVKNIEKLNYRACRERAEAFCSHAVMVDAYENLYESLIVKNLEIA